MALVLASFFAISGGLLGQKFVVGEPDWFGRPVLVRRSATEIEALQRSPAYPLIDPVLTGGSPGALTRTESVMLGRYSFEGIGSSGDLLVGTRVRSRFEYDTFKTPFGAVHSITGPFQLQPEGTAPNYQFCLVTGILPDGYSEIGCILLPAGAPFKSSCWIPLGLRGRFGEVYFTASAIDGQIYVIEGVTRKILRFVDSNGDRVPDARDPSFRIQLPPGQPTIGLDHFLNPEAPEKTPFYYSRAPIVGLSGCSSPPFLFRFDYPSHLGEVSRPVDAVKVVDGVVQVVGLRSR